MAATQQKRSRKKPVRLIDECLANSQTFQSNIKPNYRGIKDTKYYDVEIKEIDGHNRRMKLHFIGYSTEFDEWRSYDNDEDFPVAKIQRMTIPSDDSLDERRAIFCRRLSLEVKRKLLSQRKEDPEVRIEIAIDGDVFAETFSKIVRPVSKRGKNVFVLDDNSLFDEILGERWSVRLRNNRGDFQHVINGTLKFWTFERKPIDDFVPIGGKFFPYKIEQEMLLVMTFVRGSGNRRQYKEMYRL